MLAAAAAFSWSAEAATPQPRVLKAGIGLNADTPQGLGLQHFAHLIERRSEGRLKIELQAAGALGDDLKMVSQLQKGEQDITCPDSATLAKMVKAFSVINYPFTFLSEREADNILDGAWGARQLAQLDAHGLVGLAYWENGFRHMTNSKRALPTLAGASGVRMRTMQNQMLVDSFNALGFEAVPMPFPKVYAALADKTVDGQENPLPTILSSRFYDVQQHLTLSSHVYSAFVLLLSKRTWDSLTPDDQRLLRQAAAEARDYQRRMNREITLAALQQLKARGMLVTAIDARESERIRRRLARVLDRYNRDIGEGSVIDMYLELGRLRAARTP
jgi:TRAP-type transport system periplasmic protein